MDNGKRKHKTVDIIKLYAKCDAERWNQYLTKMAAQGNINELTRMLYGVQAGISDVTEKGLNSEEITVFYCRIIGSLKRTITQIAKCGRANTLVSGKIERSKEDRRLDKEIANDFRKLCF